MPGFPPRRWGRARIEVVTVEPYAAQLTWVGLGPGPLRVRIGDDEQVLDIDGGPGGVVLDGLAPGTEYAVHLDGPTVADTDGTMRSLTLRTPLAPPGEELFRMATVSDIHVGSEHFGLSARMRERTPEPVPHPLRCGGAAIDEALDWGARFLVVKGDLVDSGTPEEWAEADALLATVGQPTAFVPGNHEVRRSRSMDAPSPLPTSGVEIVDRLVHHDLPGVRLILVNTTIEGKGQGAVEHLADEVGDLAGSTDLPVLVAMHQHAQRQALPWFWPPGIPRGEARRFLDAIGRANPRALVTSGHTHRNRIRHHGPVAVTEVGSTKDFPGVWGGYTVYEGGMTQTVRRTLSPDALAWTEYTRRAVLGIWGRWSMGALTDRCVVLRWD